MVRRIIAPHLSIADVPFYLSVEEWCARNLPSGEYFFAWQVDPCIICGRHQEIDSEVNLKQAEKENVKVWRRKSGGGAVLADRNNVMFTYITPSSAVRTCFDSYTSKVCSMLNDLQIPAQPTGRNDIAVNGHKVAGNAFLKLPERSIVHGTMLYDADFNMMGRLLTPTKAKLQSKGVVSVPSRVTTLRREGITLSCAEFIKHAVNTISPKSNGIINLDDQAVDEILKIRESYLNPRFLNLSSNKKHQSLIKSYIDGVGEINFYYTLDSDSNIDNASLTGDFLPLKDVNSNFTNLLLGCKFNKDSFKERLNAINLPGIITGLTPDIFLESIFPEINKSK